LTIATLELKVNLPPEILVEGSQVPLVANHWTQPPATGLRDIRRMVIEELKATY
jgi:hypothetical protein